ncbi:unnamed protein product [Psylliodes chrysocephalus]|uniref:Uncharacterized protein n=1 Tax=Psylliodes chrysocephalus TaxID=3402493 RepID=A0A9P0GHP3_9CUCU|nr:unnamed protein product [Psylliodes chrysocephala]
MAEPLIKTRANLLCPLFGSAKDNLPEENQLPTHEDLMKCYLSVQIELKDADDHIDLIDWQKTRITEPPLTFNITNETLDDIVTGKEALNFEKFPCHTQAVERCVKLVTEASTKVCGDQLPKAYEDVVITPDILEDTPESDTQSDNEIKPKEEDDSTDEDDD